MNSKSDSAKQKTIFGVDYFCGGIEENVAIRFAIKAAWGLTMYKLKSSYDEGTEKRVNIVKTESDEKSERREKA